MPGVLSYRGEIITSMEKSPTCEADSSLVSQEIPCTLWNTQVHFHIHKSPPLDPHHKPDKSSLCPSSTSQRSILILFNIVRLHFPSSLQAF